MVNFVHKAKLYVAVEEILFADWCPQGTIYDLPHQAKYAAAKLFCNVRSVIVKRVRDGWTLFYIPSR